MRRYYQILGVSPNATLEEIKAAWLFSVKAFHPDKFSGSSSPQQRIAHERTQAINEAYAVLSDPLKRSTYDREFARQGRAEAAPPKPAGAPPPPKPASAPPRPKPASAPPPPRSAAASDGVAPASTAPAPSHPLIRGLRDYLTISGRIGRAQFIVRAIVTSLTFSIAVWVWFATMEKDTPADRLVVILALALLFVYILAVQAGKRLHDSDMSAAWVFFAAWGIGALALIVFLLLPRTVGANRFGPRLSTTTGTKITASILGGMLLLGFCMLLITLASAPNHSPSHSTKGTEIPYSMTAPYDWTTKRKVRDVDQVPPADSTPTASPILFGDTFTFDFGTNLQGPTPVPTLRPVRSQSNKTSTKTYTSPIAGPTPPETMLSPPPTPNSTSSPMPSPSPTTYRVANVRANDYLSLRQGPGSDYDVIRKLPSGIGGIELKERSFRNGETVWQEISIAGQSGYVNEIYLEAER